MHSLMEKREKNSRALLELSGKQQQKQQQKRPGEIFLFSLKLCTTKKCVSACSFACQCSLFCTHCDASQQQNVQHSHASSKYKNSGAKHVHRLLFVLPTLVYVYLMHLIEQQQQPASRLNYALHICTPTTSWMRAANDMKTTPEKNLFSFTAIYKITYNILHASQHHTIPEKG